MIPQYSATLPELQTWARDLMQSREPDLIIGDNYLRRWWVMPRNEWSNLYLHEINRSDDDRAMHDHPWRSKSVVISGGYFEHTPAGTFWRAAGDVVEREPEALHRLEVVLGKPAITLFFTGPVVRDWGFLTVCGWRTWQECSDKMPSLPGDC